jgi:hypothetical protein
LPSWISTRGPFDPISNTVLGKDVEKAAGK